VKYQFKQVDVFTARALRGNPVAIVLGAAGIPDAEMQAIARWTNLSETTFILPPTNSAAEYRLRIFTPTSELPFAGHPVVGSAHAALESGVVKKSARSFRQECGAGIIPMRVEGDGKDRRIFLRAPEAEVVHDYTTSLDAISQALGAAVSATPPPSSVRNGPVWIFCHFADPQTIAALSPDMTAVTRLSRDFAATGFACFALTDVVLSREGGGRKAEEGEGPGARQAAQSPTVGEGPGARQTAQAQHPAVYIRCFAPAVGVPEDPVTGSANAALGAYLARHGLLERTGREYLAAQGAEVGREGRIHVRVLDDAGLTEIGGQAVTVVEGELRL
jgi:PhzF family phenazine biosynthesis protein